MIIGTHHFKGYVIDITADTKPEDVEWIIKKHPEAKKTLIGNNNKDISKSSKAKPKRSKRK